MHIIFYVSIHVRDLLIIEADNDATTILANLISRIIEIQECICKKFYNSDNYNNSYMVSYSYSKRKANPRNYSY